jgi:hypothetical protein
MSPKDLGFRCQRVLSVIRRAIRFTDDLGVVAVSKPFARPPDDAGAARFFHHSSLRMALRCACGPGRQVGTASAGMSWMLGT